MNSLIKKIHIYSGLISFTALVIFGLIGIASTFLPHPDERPRPEATVREIDFDLPGNMDDRQLADHIQATLDLPLTGPAPNWSLRRDSENNLRFRLPTPGLFHNIRVMESEKRVRITTQPYDKWQYMFHLHEMTPRSGQTDLRVKLWAYYGLFNVWALIIMSLSGLYLWISSGRRGLRWAQISFAAGAIGFAIFYLVLS